MEIRGYTPKEALPNHEIMRRAEQNLLLTAPEPLLHAVAEAYSRRASRRVNLNNL